MPSHKGKGEQNEPKKKEGRTSGERKRGSHEGTDNVESDQDPAPRGTDPKKYKNIPGNQT